MREGKEKHVTVKYKRICCGMGQRLAKHGYTECQWSSKLIQNVDRIDRQWKTKSPITGALPADSLINLRRLRKCKRFKYIFNKCCEAERGYNENFIKRMMMRWRQMSETLQKKMSNDLRFDKEMRKPVAE